MNTLLGEKKNPVSYKEVNFLLSSPQMLVVSWTMSCFQNLAKYEYFLEFLL